MAEDKSKKQTLNVMSGALIGTFVGALAALYFIPIPVDNKELIIFMLGQLSGFAGGVVSYHFGTSAGSARKTELLGNVDESQKIG